MEKKENKSSFIDINNDFKLILLEKENKEFLKRKKREKDALQNRTFQLFIAQWRGAIPKPRKEVEKILWKEIRRDYYCPKCGAPLQNIFETTINVIDVEKAIDEILGIGWFDCKLLRCPQCGYKGVGSHYHYPSLGG